MNSEGTPCYVGVKSCGCRVAACVDTPEHKRETAKFISKLVRDGLRVETTTVEDVRTGAFGCKHDDKEVWSKKKKRTAQEALPL